MPSFQSLMNPLLFLGVSLLLFFSSTTDAVDPPKITLVQTHFGDESYAGGMAWDPVDNVLYLTGQVGIDGCYTAILDRTSLQFRSKQLLPEPAICQTVAMVSSSSSSSGGEASDATTFSWTWLLATAEEGGLMTDRRASGSDKAEQYGLVVPVQWNNAAATAGIPTANLPPGLLLHEDIVQTPRAIVADPVQDNGYLYVASLHSDDASTTEAFNNIGVDVIPNLTPGGIQKFGSEFFLTVERLHYDAENAHALEPGWRKPFGLLPDPSGKPLDVELATMLWNQGALVVLGSTKGSGQAFGISPDLGFSNGFITKLDPTTGKFWGNSGDSSTIAKARYLFQGQVKMHTHVVGACQANENANAFYLVGHVKHARNKTQTTTQQGTDDEKMKRPNFMFATKIDAITLELIWEKEFNATTSSTGMACGVDATNNALYVTGVISDGGNLDGTQSFGEDDIVIAQLSTEDGSANWIKQIGTSGRDMLARGNGGLVVTTDGIMVMGDTTGNFGARADREHEIFVLNVGLDGSLPITTEASGPANKGGNVPLVQSTLEGKSGSDDFTKKPKTNEKIHESKSSSQKKKMDTGSIALYVLVGVLFSLLAVGYIMVKKQHTTVTERALVFSYLQGFDVEDVDVRHSATGGWHGTYVGKLAQGGTTTMMMSQSDLEHSGLEHVANHREEETERMENLSDTGSGDGDDPWEKEVL